MFVELPFEVITTILKAWISLRDLSRLDSACCNRQSRSVYLSLLHRTDYRSSPVTMLSEESILSYMSWAADRHVLGTCDKLSYDFKSTTPAGSESHLSQTIEELKRGLLSVNNAQMHVTCMVILELNSTQTMADLFTANIAERLVTLLKHQDSNIVMYTLGIGEKTQKFNFHFLLT